MTITIETTVDALVEEAWKAWTSPEIITQWNFATDDWACPRAQLDLREGGKFNYRMEAKDGSMGFDFEGVFLVVEQNRKIEYTLGDDRKVTIEFLTEDGKTRIVESFEAEDEHAAEQQKQGWQLILNNFKKLVEQLKQKEA
ncbi:MAG: SRPBCC family protein [Akkermansiaceae bacterium]